MNGSKINCIKILAMAAAIGCGATLTSCLEDDVNTILIDPDDPAQSGGGRPGGGNDDGTGKPGTGTIVSYDLRFFMAELKDRATGEWPRLLGTGNSARNAWVEIDGKDAKVEFINPDDDGAEPLKADIALLVDNSESMDEENDAIAAGLGAWVRQLEAGGIDARYAAVGHSEEGTINGATDFSTAENLEIFFNYKHGSDRTAHFGGTGSDRLEEAAARYPRLNTECCMLALRFADAELSFREGAERVYINFTDEPNQPYGNHDYSIDWLTDHWHSTMGEVHTVYSAPEPQPSEYTALYSEPSRSLSDRTGGTVTYTDERFSNVSLADLEFCESLTHGYIARLKNVAPYVDGKRHRVVIRVNDADGRAHSKAIGVIFKKQ